jgi:hypothetical protein
MSKTSPTSGSCALKFDAHSYVARIEQRVESALLPKNAGPTAPSSQLDLSKPDSWPATMELAEVAQILRYGNEDTVRDLTDLPFDEGGLRYVSIGSGRKRRKRLVLKTDLLAFLARNSVTSNRPEIVKPKRRKPEPRRETGGLMARSAGNAPRTQRGD